MATQSFYRPFRLARPELSPRPFIALAGILALALFLSGTVAGAAGCPALQVSSLSPATLVEGDVATLSGDGFCTGASYFSWISDGSQGVPLWLQSSSTQQMSAMVGSVAASITGTVNVIKGQSLQLPDTVVQASSGIYSVRNTQLILGQEMASGGAVKAYPAASGTGTVVSSTRVNGELVLQFPLTKALHKSDSHDKSIVVVVVIQTCGEPEGDDSDDSGSNSTDPGGTSFPIPIEWVGRFEGRCFGTGDVCNGGPGDFLAAAIDDRFGRLGIKATAVPVLGSGVEVTISHQACSITEGFATVTY